MNKINPAAINRQGRPAVQLVGRVDHPDFRDVVALLTADADIVSTVRAPELIVIAQEWPGAINQPLVEELRRESPLAGIVAVVGSWCEGEPRTGRPLAGVTRLYWYEFAGWWRRQVERRAKGLCPEWVGGGDCELWISDCGLAESAAKRRGLVAIAAPWWDSFDALSDVLRSAGYETVWEKPGRQCAVARGVVAGIWDGGQLDDVESADLAAFCRRMQREAAPVVALADFPRRDGFNRAIACGAVGVLGKPWQNMDIVETLAHVIDKCNRNSRNIRSARAA